MDGAGRNEAMQAGSVLAVAAIAAGAAVWIVTLLAGLLPDGTSPPLAEALVDLLLFALLAGIALLGGLVTKQRVLSAGEHPGGAFGLGLAIGLGGFLATLLMSEVARAVGRGQAVPGGIGLAAAQLLLVTLQCAGEEIYFRGWLQPALVRGWGAWPGLLATAALFAALHILGGARDAVSVASILLAGLVFGLLALRTGGLVAPIAAHVAWNWSEEGLFGLMPNPGAGSFGALWNLDLAGPVHWGGGAEGLNASFGTLFALAALCVLLAGGAPLAVRTPARPG